MFLDRGLGDVATMPCNAALNARIVEAGRVLRYEGPIFRAPPWRAIYRQDTERVQTWDDAIASDAAVCAGWRSLGYELVDLPCASVEERADFVLARLS